MKGLWTVQEWVLEQSGLGAAELYGSELQCFVFGGVGFSVTVSAEANGLQACNVFGGTRVGVAIIAMQLRLGFGCADLLVARWSEEGLHHQPLHYQTITLF